MLAQQSAGKEFDLAGLKVSRFSQSEPEVLFLHLHILNEFLGCMRQPPPRCSHSIISSKAVLSKFGSVFPLRAALVRIPRQAFSLKKYFGCGFPSKICDKSDTLSSLGDSPKLCIENSPSKAPFGSHEASAFWPSFFRHRNRGGFRLDDVDRFFEDGGEVASFVA